MEKTSTPPAIYYGWFILGVTFFISFVTMGARNGFGVFVVPMENEFGWDRTTIAVAFFTATLVGGLSQPFIGRLFDRVGGRRVILVSLAAIGLFTVSLSLTFHIVFLVLRYGVVMSIAMRGGSLNITSALLAKWFRRRRATALGIATAGAALGGLVLVPFSAYMMDFTSWRVTWVVLGSAVLGLALPLAFLLLRDEPGEMGLLPDGDPKPSGREPSQASQTHSAGGPLEGSQWRDSLKSFPIWQLSGAYFVCGFTTNIMSMHFVAYAEGEGFARSTAAMAFGLMSGLNAIGVITLSALSDRYGRKNLLAAVYAMRGVGYAVLLLAPGAWSQWGFVCVAGFSWVATAPVTMSLTADIYGLRNLGTLTGVAFFAHQVGGSISVLLAAIIYDATGSYVIPFTICGLALAWASMTTFSIREKKYSTRYLARAALHPSPETM